MSGSDGTPDGGHALADEHAPEQRHFRCLQPRIALVVLVVFGALASGRACVAGTGDVVRGRELAQRLCAVCHLNPGQGDRTGPGTIPGFEAVARRPGQTFAGIVAWLRSVPPMMPDHHLSQDEMTALAEFILSLADGKPR